MPTGVLLGMAACEECTHTHTSHSHSSLQIKDLQQALQTQRYQGSL